MSTHRSLINEPTPLEVATSPPDPRSLDGLFFQGGINEQKIVELELKRLLETRYGEIMFGVRHNAPCTAWRSERLLVDGNRLPRFAYRVHLFQQGTSTANFGRYIGYLSLRPMLMDKAKKSRSLFKYTAVAYLAPPPHMLRPRYHIITSHGGYADGVQAFRCSAFCFPNLDADSHASCLHASLHQAVLLKMDSFGFRLIGSQDMIALLWQQQDADPNLKERKLPEEISQEGASLKQALAVLESNEVNAGGVLETILTFDFREKIYPRNEVYYEVWRCIDEYLSNGLPVIINLDPEDPKTEKAETAHFVLILGMHLLTDPEEEEFFMRIAQDRKWDRIDRAESPGRLIIHDTRQGPYIEEQTMKVLSSAWQEDENTNKSGISMLAITPRGTRIGIYHLRRKAKNLAGQETDAFWNKYVRECFPMLIVSLSRSQADELRYVVRLLRTTQVVRRYLMTKNGGQLEIHERAKQCIEQAGPSRDGWWWAVEVTLPWRATTLDSDKVNVESSDRDVEFEEPDYFHREDRPPAIIYLWHNTDDENSSPCATIRYLNKQKDGNKRVCLSVTGVEEDIEYVMSPQRA